MTEPKLKRSPYLSQMTRTANADLMASLSRPAEGSGSGGSHDVEGVSRDFFELRRPEAGAAMRARSQVQSQNNRTRKAASVTFSKNLISSENPISSASLISSSSGETSISTSIRKMSLVESEHATTCEQPQEPPKPAPLQYYYNPSMRCSAVSLDVKNLPPRSKTFRDMLDEGDGKEGDLNQRFRNEQWKAFDCLHAPNKKRRGPAMIRSNGVVSTSDIAAMRRSADRIKMNVNSTFAVLDKSGSFLSLRRHSLSNQSISKSEPQERLMATAEPTMKRSYTESLLGTRVHAVSAGLAYGTYY